jgi:hypothetical protein
MKIPQENTQNYENAPAGTFPARCYRFVDLGSHEQTYQGESKGKKRLVLLSFELPTERMEDGKPFTISKRYTWSMHEKSTLRKHLEAWRGRRFEASDFGEFDIRNVLGKACFLSITEWENGDRHGTAIESVGAPMKGIEIAPLENAEVYFSLEPEEYIHSTFETLSDSLKDTIEQSPEFINMRQRQAEAESIAADNAGPPAGDDYSERNPPPITNADVHVDEIPF